MSTPTEGVGVPAPLTKFFLTFGVQYRHEQHPFWAGAHPDGWLTVMAPDEDAARRLIRPYIGNRYAFIYEESRFKPEYHPLGELAVITARGSDREDLVAQFGESDPEYYGRDSNEVVAHRIEGILAVDSDTDAIANLGYEAETFHRGCADEGRAMFKSVSEEDDRVMAFELDWAVPHECPVCGVSIT